VNARNALVPLIAVAGAIAGWYYAGWGGVALAASALVMVVLIHLSRMLQVLRRAAQNPKGHVGSAVMLNTKLRPRVNLLHVIAMTGSLGDALTPEGQDPEMFRWSDDSGASVTCEFRAGRLVRWELARAAQPEGGP
jgi:hypothetical protein